MPETLIEAGIKRSSLALTLRGIVAIIFGVIVSIWPAATVVTLVFLFGIFAIVDGVVGIAHYVTQKQPRSTWLIVGSVISLLAGIVALIWPGLTVLALTLVIGFWAILLGVSQLVLAFQLKKVTNFWWLWPVTGIITLVFGLILVFAPGAGVLSLLWLLSTFAIIEGLLLTAVGIFLRRLSK